MSSAFNSKGCFAPGEATRVPWTRRPELIVSFPISVKLGRLSSKYYNCYRLHINPPRKNPIEGLINV